MKIQKKFVFAAILLALFSIPIMVAADIFIIQTELSGLEEVPPISTGGGGQFEASLNTETLTLDYQLTYNDLSGPPDAAHIHFGQPGVNGGVIAFLCGGGTAPACPPAGTVSGSITADDIVGPEAQGIAPGEFLDAIRAALRNAAYVNVHTPNYPEGEIRGQIASDLDTTTQPPAEESPEQ